MRKISSKYQVWSALLVVSNPAITIPCVLICCLLTVASPQEVSIVLRDNCAAYLREIKFASLPESNKAKISSLPLLSLTFQVIHLTVSKPRAKGVSSRFSLQSVIDKELLPMTAIFFGVRLGHSLL